MPLSTVQRALLFWLGCVPLRILIALFMPIPFLYLYTLLISVSMFYLYITHSRMDAFEAGGYTWWATYRIYHAGLHFTSFILLLFAQEQYARYILLLDVLFGSVLWLVQYGSSSVNVECK